MTTKSPVNCYISMQQEQLNKREISCQVITEMELPFHQHFVFG